MSGRRLLVLDSSYSLEAIRANRTEASVTCRDLGGYFDHVWTVHPFATLVTSAAWGARVGPPTVTRLAPRHDFVEGRFGRFEALAAVPPLNFLCSQAGMLRWLIRLVRDEGITVVRAGDPLLMGAYGLIVARRCRIPLLVRMSGNYERLRQMTGRPLMPRLIRSVRLERALERFVLARADMVAAPNEENRQYAIEMGAPADRTTVFRYGNLVDRVHLTDPRSRQSGERLLAEVGAGKQPFLLCVGRLEPVKMPDHAVRALALVRAQGLDASLILVGGGSMQGALESLAHTLGVATHVIFAGPRDQEWLARVIPHAAVVLSPLTGRALSEVALGAAPTVAYDLDWQGELVRTGETGVLVPNGDIEAMACAAVRLLRDRPHAVELGLQLRAAALEMMDSERLDAHERATYDRLVAGAPAASRR